MNDPYSPRGLLVIPPTAPVRHTTGAQPIVSPSPHWAFLPDESGRPKVLFFGSGEIDPFFGSSEYRTLNPIRNSSAEPTLIRWTVPDLTGEFIVRSQHLNTDMFSWTIWCSLTNDITTAKPFYLSSAVESTQIPGLGNMTGLYLPPCNYLWPVSWGGPPPVQPAAPAPGTDGIAVPTNYLGSGFIRLPGPTIHFS